MLTHVVLWKLHDTAGGKTKAENAILLKEKLENLVEIIPQIVELKVGINLATVDATNYDVMLYSKFENIENLMKYQNHAAHKAVGEWIGKIRESRVAIDF